MRASVSASSNGESQSIDSTTCAFGISGMGTVMDDALIDRSMCVCVCVCVCIVPIEHTENEIDIISASL
jgi:hypothetical protein